MKKSISYKRESEMQHKAQLWNGCQEKNMTEFAISTVWRDQTFDRYRIGDFLSKKSFSDTNTETFFPRPNFLRPILRLFFRDQIFQDRYRDFYSEIKFVDTDTETFFRDQIFRYRYRDSQKNGICLETETETGTETFAYDWQLLGTSTDNF